MGDLFTRKPSEQRLDMFVKIGAGVDHSDLAKSDDIRPGAPEGEGAGVAGNDAADHWRDRLEPTVFERKIAAEGDLDSHIREITRHPAWRDASLRGMGQNPLTEEGGAR